MRRKKGNAFWVFIFAQMMIFILAIQGSRLVISTIPKADEVTELARLVTANACQHSELTISCKANERLHIVYANYGRLRGDICEHLSYNNLNCCSNNSLSIVRHQCSGKSNCTVPASNSIFGDPCPNTTKYLTVTHQCLSEVTELARLVTANACQHSELTISCKANESIHIVYANYGRLRGDGCKPLSYNNLNCCSNNSLSIVRHRCSEKSNCTVPASNNIFGDPCPNTTKYLTVTHQCLSATKRNCGSNAKGSHAIDLSECVSKEIVELQDKLDSLTRNFSLILVRELMDGLDKRVSTGGELYGGDLEALAKIMVAGVNLTQIKGVMNVSDIDRILESVVNTTSILLQPKNIDTWMDLPRTKQSSTATRLLWSVESSSAFRANSISETKNFKVTAPGLDVIVDDLMQKNFSASFNWVGTHDTVDYLEPRVPEAGNGLGRVTVALFDGVGQWLHVNESATKYPDLNATSSAVNDSFSEDTPEATSVLVVNTRVMSISIVSRSGIDAEKVRYILEHKEKRNSDSDPVCVFWKYSKETFEGHWSDEGCRDVTNCPYCNYTVCECDHLTNFAVLMSVSGHQNLMSLGNAFALSAITYLGCIISIVCLALAFITFYWFK